MKQRQEQLPALIEFWLDRREGFCEHFSAAFVVIMRALDVPARIVTGYQGADPLPVDGYYIVRQSHAHAWAEYWLEGAGWVIEGLVESPITGPQAGQDYPRNWNEFLDWFGSEEACLPYLERLRDEVKLPILYVSHVIEEAARLTAPFDALVHVLDGEAEVRISGKPFHLKSGDERLQVGALAARRAMPTTSAMPWTRPARSSSARAQAR